jgi:SSS family solute:Na+ symporter
LRWFWWRINAWSEITSMLSALILANGFLWVQWLHNFGLVSDSVLELIISWYNEDVALIRATVLLLLCTSISILVTFLTKPVDNETLLHFYTKVRPKGWWGPISKQVPKLVDNSSSRESWLGFLFGVIFLNSILFAVGHAVLGGYQEALILLLVGIGSGWLTLKYVDSLKTQEVDENS